MRELKFRVWDSGTKVMHQPALKLLHGEHTSVLAKTPGTVSEPKNWTWQQYLGLKDKNDDTDIYECDIIDSDGNVIGNQYETPALLEEKANLLIQGFGTGGWLTTYTQAVERGCKDA